MNPALAAMLAGHSVTALTGRQARRVSERRLRRLVDPDAGRRRHRVTATRGGEGDGDVGEPARRHLSGRDELDLRVVLAGTEVERLQAVAGELDRTEVRAHAQRATDTAGNGDVALEDGPRLALRGRALAVRVGLVDVVQLVDLHDRVGGRRAAAVPADLDLGRGGGQGAGVAVSLHVVHDLDAVSIHHRDTGALGEEDRRTTVAEREGVDGGVEPGAAGAGDLERHRSLDDRLRNRLAGLLDVLLVPHLHDLVPHGDVAADVVEAGLDQATTDDVVRVAVLAALVVEHQDGVVLETPDEADQQTVLPARVADAGALLQDDDLGTTRLLVDDLGAVGAGRLHLEVRGLADLLLGDLDVVVGVLPADLGGPLDQEALPVLDREVGLAEGEVLGDDGELEVTAATVGGVRRRDAEEREHGRDEGRDQTLDDVGHR